MSDWNVENWNDFDDASFANDIDLDAVVTVNIIEDMICPACLSDRIIQNWKYPERFCCIDCGLIFEL